MATMAASPRKDAPAFEQTWDETDAAFLDPTSLPLQRLPRAWDRKQELKKIGNGKTKEIWRRYGTRSRTSDGTTKEDPEGDGRSRPVKKQQCMSPNAIEKSATSRFGKTRAFKTTRWDRRKSVLPRKKVLRADTVHEHGDLSGDDEEAQHTTLTGLSNSSFSEIDDITSADATLPHSEHVNQSMEVEELLQSPTKGLVEGTASAEPLSYPELPSLPEVADNTPIEADKDHDSEANTKKCTEETESLKTGIGQLECEHSNFAIQEVSNSPSSTNSPFEELDPLRDSLQNTHEAVQYMHETQDESEESEMDEQDDLPDENFTEASLQLDIQHAMETTLMPDSNIDLEDAVADAEEPTWQGKPPVLHSSARDLTDDITMGLTLEPVKSLSREPTPRKLRSPSPPPRTDSGPDDATMTFAFDDDTALLKDFLSRAAANKAANKTENISRRESLQNRRDSDVVRHALASPRKVLEDKDPNSPSKHDYEATLDLSQTLTLSMEPPALPSSNKAHMEAEARSAEDSKVELASRRSSRMKKSRLPAPLSVPPGPPKIAVKRDGGDPVILKKTDAQELSVMTRSNTRRNKQGAVAASVRLLKLSNDTRNADVSGSDATGSPVPVPGKKCVRWDSQLTYFQKDTETIANALADAESLATPDELSSAPPSATPTKLRTPKVPKDRNTTPKVRKVRNLGSSNGTPGKGLQTPASLLPDAMLEIPDELQEKQRLPKPKSSRIRKATVGVTDTGSATAAGEPKLPMLEIAPVGIDPSQASSTKERKSRLATPRKMKLPVPASSTSGDGREKASKGSAASIAKRGIPVPSAVVSRPVEVSSVTAGLPKRRGRRL